MGKVFERYTTIMLETATKDRLEAMKEHPRQSYDELLNKLLDEKERKRGIE